MSKQFIEERIRQIAEEIAKKVGYELVHVEKKGAGKSQTLRVFIDKKGGISHADCSLFSNEFGAVLDIEDLIPTEYTLEVSSPGLERELYNLKDFEKFAGNLAKVKLKTPINGQKNFRGRILKVKDGEIFFNDKTVGEVNFPYRLVNKANLEIDLEEELKRNG
jgi:ribosome maturation factor RimP